MSTIWHLKPKADRRFRSGHPWVYSNELAESPKGLEPGAAVELREPGGKFLARGYGNPSSLISFRVLTRLASDAEPMSEAFIAAQIQKCFDLRLRLGLSNVSYRLCFGEADGLPGLIIDRYSIDDASEGGVLVYVIQAHSAGADRMVTHVFNFLKNRDSSASFVLRNDVGVRKLEGLEIQEPKILQAYRDLTRVPIRIAASDGVSAPLIFYVNLVEGQKTGFFLDQASNVALAAKLLKPQAGGPIRILDLCTYVGQWGAQLAHSFKKSGSKVHVTAVDASATALEFAKQNIQAQGAEVTIIRGDIMTDLAALPDRSFDLIISDPPALIKGRKNIPAGTHGYLQLNTQVFRLVKSGGSVVCSSCSSLLEEEEFLRVLSKAAFRNQRSVQWIARGTQAPDHPVLAEFPEGRYLKAWVGICR